MIYISHSIPARLLKAWLVCWKGEDTGERYLPAQTQFRAGREGIVSNLPCIAYGDTLGIPHHDSRRNDYTRILHFYYIEIHTFGKQYLAHSSAKRYF